MKTLTTCLAATVLLAGCAANDDPAAEFGRDGDRTVRGMSWPEADDLDSTRGSESTPPVPASANENAGAASPASYQSGQTWPSAAVAPNQDQPATKSAREKPLTAADVPPPDPAKAYVPQGQLRGRNPFLNSNGERRRGRNRFFNKARRIWTATLRPHFFL